MTLLIDILHPAHVHVFRNVRTELLRRGHRVIVTARQKEMSLRLLDAYEIPHTVISRQKKGVGLIAEMIARTARLIRVCRREQPNLLIGIMGPSIAVAGALLRIPAWVCYDTENAWITNWFAFPLARRVYTPECYQGRRRNQITYVGYHELAYLHPARFCPDDAVVKRCGIDSTQPYFVVRFVGWQASHDIGERGLSHAVKRRIVDALARHGRVLISSESALPSDLADRQLPCAEIDAHHVMAFARMVVGESATMASEAAVLGVPAVFISDTGRGYTTEQEQRYSLVRNFTTAQIEDALAWIEQELADPSSLDRIASARSRLLSDCVDVTDFFVKQVEAATCAA